ncbi:MAG: hypothetical protein AAFY03_09510, partial [Pseudomonadota bacterium]
TSTPKATGAKSRYHPVAIAAPVAFGVLVLQLITPVAVASYLLSERYDAQPDAVAGLVVVSTLLSVLFLTLALSLLLPIAEAALPISVPKTDM